MADTFGDMYGRIQEELDRADAATLGFIKKEIVSAIHQLKIERFPWNERKFASFNTVAGTQDYVLPTTDSAAVAIRIIEIDILTATVNSHIYSLKRTSIQIVDDLTSNTAHRSNPSLYAIHNEKIWLYPIPNAVYAINGRGLVDINAITSASATGATNAWMEEKNGEELVRTLARAKVMASYLKDGEGASEALGQHGAVLARMRNFYSKRVMPDESQPWGY